MNHALKVLYLTQVPRLSITSQFFNLSNKFPRELEPLLPLFKETVLKPAVMQLLNVLDQLPTISNNTGLEFERDEHVRELLDAQRIDRLPRVKIVTPKAVENLFGDMDFWNPTPALGSQNPFADSSGSTVYTLSEYF